jgi:hypothetical protein
VLDKNLRKSSNCSTNDKLAPLCKYNASYLNDKLFRNNKEWCPIIVFFAVVSFGTIFVWIVNMTYLSMAGGLFYIRKPGKIPKEVVLEQIKSRKTIFIPRDFHGTYQRAYKKIMLTLRQRPRILILGSSHAIKISHNIFNVEPDEFYNAGLVSATTSDFLSMWQIAKDQNKLPELVIYVCASHDFRGKRDIIFHKEFLELNQKMYSDKDVLLFNKYLSLTYLMVRDRWEVLKFAMRTAVLRNLTIDMLENKGLLTSENPFRLEDEGVLLPRDWGYNYDGTLVYDKKLELRDTFANNEIIKKMNRARLKKYFDREIDSNDVKLLEVFLRDARRHNAKVIFLFPPYSEFGTSVINERGREYFNWIEKVKAEISGLAKKYSVESYLTIDASFYNCGNDEYTGASHPKESCYKKIFLHIRESTASPLVRELIRS